MSEGALRRHSSWASSNCSSKVRRCKSSIVQLCRLRGGELATYARRARGVRWRHGGRDIGVRDLGAITVAGPVISTWSPQRKRRPWRSINTFMADNNAVIMMIELLGSRSRSSRPGHRRTDPTVTA